LENIQLERLASHVAQITHALMDQVDRDGIIRTFIGENETTPDIVASHHLVELLLVIDKRGLFRPTIKSIIQWMNDPKHQAMDSPFFLDCLSQEASVNKENTQLFRREILNTRLPDGGFEKYTGHIRSGDYFSTLWCTKILLNYSKDEFQNEIESALSYLISRRKVAVKQINHLGFLGLLLLRYDHQRYFEVCRKIFEFIKNKISTEGLFQSDNFLLTEKLFVIEDVLEWIKVSEDAEAKTLVIDSLSSIFNLEQAAEAIPSTFKSVEDKYVQSLFYQTLARGCIVGYKLCSLLEYQENIADEVNRLFQTNYRQHKYVALTAQNELKRFYEIYGKIHENFKVYDEILEKVWQQSPREKTIFLMMPFKNDIRYRELTKHIKSVCKDFGFKAIRVDDEDRQFRSTLWENLIVNMLSAKYAISIYVDDADPMLVQSVNQDKTKYFLNPNVALEFGWFTSRGQEILLLKDKESNIPSDLHGFIEERFDINNPEETVVEPLRKWLKKLQRQEEEKDN
jgi:hypothetical protein